MVMELIGKKISTDDVLLNMTHTDDLDITAESKHEETLEMWKKVFKNPTIRCSLAELIVRGNTYD